MELNQKWGTGETDVLHKVAACLEQEGNVIGEPEKLCKLLGITVVDLKSQFNGFKYFGTTKAYTLIVDILSFWKSRSYSGFATVERLIEILKPVFPDAAGILERDVLGLAGASGSDPPNNPPTTSRVSTVDGVSTENPQTVIVNGHLPEMPPPTSQLQRLYIGKSEIVKNLRVDINSWVVSLVRNEFHPDKTISRLHTFVVLEGEGEEGMETHFMDFGPSPACKGALGTIVRGSIRYEKFEGSSTQSLVFKSHRMLCKEKHKGKALKSQLAFTLNKGQAEALLKLFFEGFNKQPHPDYHVMGHQNILNRISAQSSSTMAGHNCATWASALLEGLEDEAITSSIRQPPHPWAVLNPHK